MWRRLGDLAWVPGRYARVRRRRPGTRVSRDRSRVPRRARASPVATREGSTHGSLDVSWLTFSCLFACHLPNAESGWGLVRSGLALMMVPPKMAAAARKIMLSPSKTNGMVSLRV